MKTLKPTVLISQKEKKMKKTLIAKFSRFLLTIIVSLCACGAASAADDKKALGQLEGAAGQSINNVQVPSVQTPSVTSSTDTAGGYTISGSTGTAGGTSTPTVKPTTQGDAIIKPAPKPK